MSVQKLIIDTDPGQDIDDLLALTFALQRPELDIQAITTVTWPSDRRARLVKRLLRYLNRSDIPVGTGMQFPLRPFTEVEARAQYDVARTMNHDSFADPEDMRDQPDTLDAVDLIIRTVNRHPGEIVLACIAPLTNIACALRRAPDIAGKIKYIAMMGGELRLNRVEHNVAFDYIATDAVLSSGIPLYMGTWDVTRRFSLSMQECDAFKNHPSPLCRALGQAIDQWHPVQPNKPGPVMYDIFPIVWAFDRSYYTTTPMPVRIETRGELTRGMTVAGGDADNIEVTTDIHVAELKKFYLDTVIGGSVAGNG